ncbi:hypothetical protein [Trinickia symbiotica]|uniref:Uncharacterized protein n=1 Tax=Trinickia symbiotica TaxID=863227 RepID=A0A2N7XA11_9BURK|nr:hypothetical protein [Trinickia symbiotica]PMS38447.1 hypothetical protein C0Z20_00750 [Trinickia symbiotica]
MSAFSDIDYREDGPEDVHSIAGSTREPFTLAHVARTLPACSMVNDSPIAAAALDRIKGILRERQGRNRPGQSTTPAGSVGAARRAFYAGRA